MLASCAGAKPRNAENLCDIYQEKRAWYKASLKAEKKWGIPLQIPMAIMYQESTFRRRARPPRKWYLGFIPGRRASSAYGYAQVIDGTWAGYIKDTGDYWRRRTRFEDALDFVNYYLTRAAKENGVSNDDAYRFYLNYHEGLAGFRRESYRSKPGLKRAAVKVRDRSKRYANQYRECAKELGKGWFRRLIGS